MYRQIKKLGLFPAHPSQLWMMYSISQNLPEWIEPIWVLRNKDCMEELAQELGIKAIKIRQAGKGIIKNAVEMFDSIFDLMILTKKEEIDCWYSKYGAANIASFINRIPNISFNDDDYDLVPLIAWTSYPFASQILCPESIRMGRFEKKTLRYNSFHELYYLHPNRFEPDPEVLRSLKIDLQQKYCVIRLSALDAHHDIGVKGMQFHVVDELICILPTNFKLYITSEKILPKKYRRYQLHIPAHKMHHVLAFAHMLVGDSQTMTSEAAMLGVPAYRLSDFVGKISNIAELESMGLCYGYLPEDSSKMLMDIRCHLKDDNFNKEHKIRQRRMLAQKSDPIPLTVRALEAQLDS